MLDRSFSEELVEARNILTKGSKILGIPISSNQVDQFLSYLSLLMKWNETFNLTSISDPISIVRLHFLDSLAIAPFVSHSEPFLDVGSGAGFPGMPLKILFPDMVTTLVEPRRKRANFLRALTRLIQARGVTIIDERIENLSHQLAGSFSTVALRAVGNLEFFLSTLKPLLQAGGRCLIMHGPKGSILFEDVRALALRQGFLHLKIHKYAVPLGDESRTLLIIS